MSQLPVDEDAIRALARILTDTGLTEIEVSSGDSRVRVARKPAPVLAAAPVAAAAPAALAAPAPAAPPPTAEDAAAHPGAVTSPMVGIAFLSPEPGSPPYVTQGQQVQAGQTLLLIEAMKTFNQIKAPRAGTVGRILVGSGSPVEYGEALMIVEA
ncbi:MAG: acetyl-CoA carboxylase biotin carboxyl carrier protein [Janthinobacterium lividum]